MYSVIVDGKVKDIHYRRLAKVQYQQAVYLEDVYIGSVFNMKDGSWSCVPNTPHDLSPFDGFKTRTKAMEMILKVEGYHR